VTRDYSITAVIRFSEGRRLSGSIITADGDDEGGSTSLNACFFKEPRAIDSAAKGIHRTRRPNVVNTNTSTDAAVIDQRTEISSARVSNEAGKQVGSPGLPRGAGDISSYRSRRNRERLFMALRSRVGRTGRALAER